MPKSTNKTIADTEAARSHHVGERLRPEHALKGKAKDTRARHLEREVAKEARKK